MTDPVKTIKALLSKTVARGATPAEEASARAMAEKLAKKHNINLASLEEKPQGAPKMEYPPHDANNFWYNMQKAQAWANFVAQQKAKAAAQQTKQATPKTEPKQHTSYKKAEEPKKKTAWNSAGMSFVENLTAEEAAKMRNTYKTVVKLCRHYIQAGFGYEAIAALARKVFGGKTSKASVAWYASQMNKESK